MEQPAPPASLHFRGVDYELHSTESVRRNTHPASTDELGGAVTETVLDLETSQKSSVCLVWHFSADVRTCTDRVPRFTVGIPWWMENGTSSCPDVTR